MKKTMPLLCLLVASGAVLGKDVYVDGHYRRDGTYVEPYHRSSPNNSTDDNYGTKGNSNPYTGQQGTVSPDNQHSKPYGSGDGRGKKSSW